MEKVLSGMRAQAEVEREQNAATTNSFPITVTPKNNPLRPAYHGALKRVKLFRGEADSLRQSTIRHADRTLKGVDL